MRPAIPPNSSREYPDACIDPALFGVPNSGTRKSVRDHIVTRISSLVIDSGILVSSF